MGLAFLITTDNLALLSERKVLREHEYAALLDAAALVDVARVEAERIVEAGVAQAEQARRRAYEEGTERARVEQARRMLAEGTSAERQLQALRGAMARIVARAVEKFVAEADASLLLQNALQNVDALIREEPFITVRVSPAQEDALRRAVARLDAGDLPWLRKLRIVADSTLAAQACVLQTPSGALEIGVDAQIEAFRAAVERQGLGAEEAVP